MQSCKRYHEFRPEPENQFDAQIMPEKNPKVKLGLKNLAMLPSYFDYIFVHQRQKVRLRSEISVNFRPNPTLKARLELKL